MLLRRPFCLGPDELGTAWKAFAPAGTCRVGTRKTTVPAISPC